MDAKKRINSKVLMFIDTIKTAFKPPELPVAKFVVDLLGCFYAENYELLKCCICRRCHGCENCDESLRIHCTVHWNNLNKKLFLFAVAMQFKSSDLLALAMEEDNKELNNIPANFKMQNLNEYYNYFVYTLDYLQKFPESPLRQTNIRLAAQLYIHRCKLIYTVDEFKPIQNDNTLFYNVAFAATTNETDIYHTFCQFYKMNNEIKRIYSDAVFYKYGVGKLRSISYLMQEFSYFKDNLDTYLITIYNEIKKIYDLVLFSRLVTR